MHFWSLVHEDHFVDLSNLLRLKMPSIFTLFSLYALFRKGGWGPQVASVGTWGNESYAGLPTFFVMKVCTCMYQLYLNGYQKHDKTKLKRLNLPNKSSNFNFDLSYLLYPFRYRITLCLIGKLAVVVNMSQEAKVVAALIRSVEDS